MASQNTFSSNLGLPAIPDTQDTALYMQLFRIYNAINALAYNLDKYTGAVAQPQGDWSTATPNSSVISQNFNRLYVPFANNIGLGACVNLYNNGGVLTAKFAKADATANLARAYCSTPGGVLAGAFGEVILQGLHPYLSGLTPGTLYYLSATSTTGQITNVAPAIAQAVGFALSTTALWFAPTLM